MGGFCSKLKATTVDDEISQYCKEALDAATIKDNLMGEEADCGPSKDKSTWFLSYAHAKREAASAQVTKKDGRPYSLGSDFGHHCCSIFQACGYKDVSVLKENGIGLELYFKYLKFMIAMFFVLSLLSLPALIGFYQGSYVTPMEKEALISNAPVAALQFSTAGSWGEGFSTCEDVKYVPYDPLMNATYAASLNVTQLEYEAVTHVNIECRVGTVLGIQAFYGQPEGSCTCPGKQQLGSDAKCRGDIDENDDETCDSPDFPCFLGATDMGEACCSHDLDGEGHADLDAVNVKPFSGCNSYTAQRIVEAECLGKESCSLSLDPEHQYESEELCEATCRNMPDETPEAEANAMGGSDKCTLRLEDNERGEFGYCSPEGGRVLSIKYFCADNDLPQEGLDKPDFSLLIACLDALAMLIFFLALRWLRTVEANEVDEHDAEICSTEDYTLRLNSLPKHDDPKKLIVDLKNHMEHCLNDKKITKHVPLKYLSKNKASANYPHMHEDVKGTVIDINLGMSTSVILQFKKAQGKKARRLDQLKSRRDLEVIGAEKDGKLESNAHKFRLAKLNLQLDLAAVELRKAQAMLTKQEEKDEKGRAHGVCAFITFRDEESTYRALTVWPRRSHGQMGKFLRMMWQTDCFGGSSALRFQGKVMNLIEPAEPENVIWEHLAYNKFQRAIRQFVTTCVIVVFLMGSFASIMSAKIAEGKALAGFPTTDCTVYDQYRYNSTDPFAKMAGTPEVLTKYDVQVDQNYAHLGLELGKTGVLGCMCTDVLSAEGPTFLREMMFNATSLDQECIDENDGDDSQCDLLLTPEPWCEAWLTEYIGLYGYKYSAVAIVSSINVVLEAVITWATKFEKHINTSSEVASFSLKLALGTFVNTAIITVILNANLVYFGVASTSAPGDVSFFDGSYHDFSAGWYDSVGVALLLTMVVNAMVPHGSPFFKFLLTKWKRFADRKFHCVNRGITTRTTQAELDTLYIGPMFALNRRYAYQLNYVFVTLMLSATMPILNLFALGFFVVFYFLDKLLILRFFRAPVLDASAQSKVTGTLYYAIVLHMLVSAWSLTNDAIMAPAKVHKSHGCYEDNQAREFEMNWSDPGRQMSQEYNDQPFFARMAHPNIVPYYCVAFLMVGLIFSQRIIRLVFGILGAVFRLLCPWFTPAAPDRWEANPAFVEALSTETLKDRVQSEIIKGETDWPDLPLLELYQAEYARRKAMFVVVAQESMVSDPGKKLGLKVNENLNVTERMIGCEVACDLGDRVTHINGVRVTDMAQVMLQVKAAPSPFKVSMVVKKLKHRVSKICPSRTRTLGVDINDNCTVRKVHRVCKADIHVGDVITHVDGKVVNHKNDIVGFLTTATLPLNITIQTAATRTISGLDSYDMNCNLDYLKSFALDSSILYRQRSQGATLRRSMSVSRAEAPADEGDIELSMDDGGDGDGDAAPIQVEAVVVQE